MSVHHERPPSLRAVHACALSRVSGSELAVCKNAGVGARKLDGGALKWTVHLGRALADLAMRARLYSRS